MESLQLQGQPRPHDVHRGIRWDSCPLLGVLQPLVLVPSLCGHYSDWIYEQQHGPQIQQLWLFLHKDSRQLVQSVRDQVILLASVPILEVQLVQWDRMEFPDERPRIQWVRRGRGRKARWRVRASPWDDLSGVRHLKNERRRSRRRGWSRRYRDRNLRKMEKVGLKSWIYKLNQTEAMYDLWLNKQFAC